MASSFAHFPWTIASGASASQAIDIEANSTIVGVLLATNGVWTAGKVGFQGYQPDSGKTDGGLDWLDLTNALYRQILTDAGAFFAAGDGAAVGKQYIILASTAASPAPIIGVRYVKVASLNAAGNAVQNQAQSTTGFLFVRWDH